MSAVIPIRAGLLDVGADGEALDLPAFLNPMYQLGGHAIHAADLLDLPEFLGAVAPAQPEQPRPIAATLTPRELRARFRFRLRQLEQQPGVVEELAEAFRQREIAAANARNLARYRLRRMAVYWQDGDMA